ncbi:MAG: S24 family peptidase [Saprospiraceae bacterium]|nr:S24 family peptidase [Saprospiraceae bacterium]
MGNFSDHIVNQRFSQVFQELEKRNIIKGKSDIAKKLGTYNHVINSILKGQRNITVDQLNKLFDHFSINANYLFGISLQMFLPNAEITGGIPARDKEERQFGRSGNIVLAPLRALAGDAINQESNNNDNLPRFSIPGLDGNLIAVEISGDSMLPTITNGDLVICEKLRRGAPIRDNHVYVVVTDVVVAKRVQQIKSGTPSGKLRLISDNDVVYKPYEVDLEEVKQILEVKCRLTSYAIS